MFTWQKNERLPRLIPVLLIIAACAVALASPFIVELIAIMGEPLRRDDVISDYLVGLIWTIVLGISIFFWPVPPQHRQALLWLWLVRAMVVLGVMLLFEYYYKGLDAVVHFEHAVGQQQLAWGDTGTQRIRTLVWLHNQVFPATYHAVKASASLVGLVAIYLFYRAGMLFVQRDDIRLLYMLGLFPSILFWSSLLGKDPVVLFGIALYAYGVVGQYRNRKWYHFAFIAGGIFIAAFIRPWMGFVLTAPLAFLFFTRVKPLGFQIIFAGFFVVIALTTFNTFTETFQLESTADFLEQVSTLQGNVARRQGGSTTNTTLDLTSMQGALVFLPIGIVTALFRPIPGEVLNLFGLLAGLENALLLVLAFLAIKRSHWSDIWNPIILWMIAVVLLWATFYAFVTFNMGMIVRYKLQILPILVCLLIYLVHKRSEPRLC